MRPLKVPYAKVILAILDSQTPGTDESVPGLTPSPRPLVGPVLPQYSRTLRRDSLWYSWDRGTGKPRRVTRRRIGSTRPDPTRSDRVRSSPTEGREFRDPGEMVPSPDLRLSQ